MRQVPRKYNAPAIENKILLWKYMLDQYATWVCSAPFGIRSLNPQPLTSLVVVPLCSDTIEFVKNVRFNGAVLCYVVLRDDV